MPTPTQTLPRLTFTYKEWLHDTGRSTSIRSSELKALDSQVDGYIRLPSASRLEDLRRSFRTWAAKSPDWVQSRSNKNSAFSRLDAELNKGGDTDRPRGDVQSMGDDLANARLGVLYLFSGMSCDNRKFSIVTEGVLDLTGGVLGYNGDMNSLVPMQDMSKAMPTAKKIVMTGSEAAIEKMEARRKVSSQQLLNGKPPAPPAHPQNRQAQEQVTQALERIATDVAKQVSASVGDNRDTHIANVPKTFLEESAVALRVMVNIVGAHFFANAIPLVSGAMSIGNGLVNALYSGHARYIEYSHGRHINVRSGYASSVVKEIRRAMEIGTCAGMYEMLKGSTKITVETLTAAAGSPVTSLVFSVIEAVVNTVWKLYDLWRMNHFFAEAKRQFALREQPMGLHRRPSAFHAWYRHYAVGTPAISMVALKSGLCGDKMRFLEMYDGTDNQLAPNPSQFTAREGNQPAYKNDAKLFETHSRRYQDAAQYVDELKVYGANYLNEVGYQFNSTDPLINELLKNVRPSPVPNDWSKAKRLVSPFQKFLTTEA